MATEFHALLLEGVFFVEDGTLHCRSDDGSVVEVIGHLRPLLGQSVHFAAHHVPPMPPRIGAWGMGSCLGESRGYCAFGHEKRPMTLLQIHGQGVLGADGVRMVNGTRLSMKDVTTALVDHHARLLAASAMSVEQMRDSVLAAGLGNSVDDLVQRAGDLQGLMTKIAGMTGGLED